MFFGGRHWDAEPAEGLGVRGGLGVAEVGRASLRPAEGEEGSMQVSGGCPSQRNHRAKALRLCGMAILVCRRLHESHGWGFLGQASLLCS